MRWCSGCFAGFRRGPRPKEQHHRSGLEVALVDSPNPDVSLIQRPGGPGRLLDGCGKDFQTIEVDELSRKLREDRKKGGIFIAITRALGCRSKKNTPRAGRDTARTKERALERVVRPHDAEGARAGQCPDASTPPVDGCGHEFDLKAADRSGKFKKDDALMEHYKKTGLFGAITGAFGDKKTMYCHHVASTGDPAVRAAKAQGKTPRSAEEVWQIIGRKPCCGRFAYDSSTGTLKCGSLSKKDHDNTCNKDTCLFVAHGLECPIPKWAHK